jgi:hypothetical protein
VRILLASIPVGRVVFAALAVALFLGCGSGSAVTEVSGEPVNPAEGAGPALRPDTPTRGILFGGYDGTALADTWSFDGTSWRRLERSPAPTARADAVMASQNGAIVLYSGLADSIEELPAGTWALGGDGWVELDVAGPSLRWASSMGALGSKLVLFGGFNASGVPLSDTWTFDGAAWDRLSTAGPDSVYNAVMAALGDELVLIAASNELGGLAQTWKFVGAAWEKLDVRGPTRMLTSSRVVMAPLGRNLVLVSGDNEASVRPAETWTFDGKAWKKLDVAGPPGRAEAAMTPVRGKLVLFGGVNGAGHTLGDTWTFDGATWERIAVSGPPARYDAAFASK